MKTFLRFIFTACIIITLSACGADKVVKLSVVPYPQDVIIENGSFDAFGASVLSKGLLDEEAAIVKKFGELIKEASGGVEKSYDIIFSRDEALAPEEYRLEIGGRRVKVYSSSYNGTLYAVLTLMQLMPKGVYTGSYDIDADWNIPCAKITKLKDLQYDPHFIERGMIVDFPTPQLSVPSVKARGQQIHMSGTPAEIGPGPQLNEHGDEILKKVLGYDEAQIEALRESGAFGK